MSTRTPQHEAASLKVKLSLLGFYPGFFDTGGIAGVREFYEDWQRANQFLIETKSEDSHGHLSFVDDQLKRFLNAYPAEQTHIGILEVFPAQSPFSAIVYGWYLAKLEAIAANTPAVAG